MVDLALGNLHVQVYWNSCLARHYQLLVSVTLQTIAMKTIFTYLFRWILPLFVSLAAFGQGSNTNQWTAILNSVVDDCNSITFTITVSSPSTSKELSHVTFGFPVNANTRTRTPGSAVWSYGNDGSYQNDIPGINSPFNGIKDDAGTNDAGFSIVYTFTYTGTNYATIKNWVNGANSLIVLTKAGTSPNGGFVSYMVDPVITTPCIPPCTPPTVAAITGFQEVCRGTNVQFNNATPNGVWTSLNTAVATVNNNGQVTGVAAGTATIRYTVTASEGCSTIVTRNILVKDPPAIPPAITGANEVCVGATTSFTNTTPNGFWLSNQTDIATVHATTGVVTGVAEGTARIRYIIEEQCGVAEITKDIQVNGPPARPAIFTGATQVCAGSQVTWTTATTGGVWSSAQPLIATIHPTTGLITGVAAGTAQISYTITNNCGTNQRTVAVTVTNCGNQSGNQNEWIASVDSIIDDCESMLWIIRVTSPGTSKDLSHVTFGFPVNTTLRTRTPGNAIWSFGNDGSYQNFFTGISSPFLGIKDDAGTTGAGFTITYTFTFTGADYNRMKSWVVSDSNLVVLMKAGVTPNGGFTRLVIDPEFTISCGVSGGATGGVESYSLGEVIGKRNIAMAKAGAVGEINYGATPKWNGPATNDRGGVATMSTGAVRLADIMPAGLAGYQAFVTSPTDLTQFTNAVEVMSVDFTRSNIARGVAFATKTLDQVYNHTKPICDRLRGAQMLGVERVSVGAVNMLAYKIRQESGKVEYAMSFSAGAKVGRDNFNIESKWFTKDYTNDDVMYNFQVWAETPEMMRQLATDILNRLQAAGRITQGAKNAALPGAYVVAGRRQGSKMILTLENTTEKTTGYFELDEKLSEQAQITKRKVPFTLQGEGRSTIELDMRDGFESDVRMFINGELMDLVYMSDGIWGLDYDRARTTIKNFAVSNDAGRVYQDEYPLFRDVKIEGTTSNYITAYKFLRGGAAAADLRAFKTLRFEATGGHKLKIMLVKEGVKEWKDQYTYTINLDQAKREYQISLNDFVSTGVSGKINPNDITSVVFSIEVSAANTAVNTTLAKVGFTKVDVDYLRSLEAKEVQAFPNPNNGRFTVQFRSAVEMPLTMRMTDAATGRVVMSRAIQAVQGENQVTVELGRQDAYNGGQRILILHLNGANGVTYKPVKVMMK